VEVRYVVSPLAAAGHHGIAADYFYHSWRMLSWRQSPDTPVVLLFPMPVFFANSANYVAVRDEVSADSPTDALSTDDSCNHPSNPDGNFCKKMELAGNKPNLCHSNASGTSAFPWTPSPAVVKENFLFHIRHSIDIRFRYYNHIGWRRKNNRRSRGISMFTLTSAIAETGAKTTNVKNNTFKINFFIGLLPPEAVWIMKQLFNKLQKVTKLLS